MAALEPYTALKFKGYLHRILSHTAVVLGWSVDGSDYDEILNDTLIALGVDDVASITDNADLKMLRAVGRYFLWQAVAAATVGDYQFSADGGSYNRQQVHDHALKMLAQAESEAAYYGVVDAYNVTVSNVAYHRDPYRDYNDELATQIDQL